jgi:hypothetical protein
MVMGLSLKFDISSEIGYQPIIIGREEIAMMLKRSDHIVQ